ncbi:MAG: MerR family transcriptional regulator [Bdellovibrionales bacterium]
MTGTAPYGMEDIQEPGRETIITQPVAKTPYKSATAYRTISEAADELGVPQHVLRFWETKFSQIRPMKRSGGRRFYRPEDIHVLHTIKGLLYDQGYTIKGVQRLLKLRRGLQNIVEDMKAAPEPPPAPPAFDLSAQISVRPEPVVDLTDTAEGEGEPDLFAGQDADIYDRIPDHLPAKPAALMAQGIMEGNPMPEPTGLTTEQRLQLQSMVAELKALKSLLN